MRQILLTLLLISAITATGASALRPTDARPGIALADFCWSEAEADTLTPQLLEAFRSYEIPEAVAERMRGKSYPEGCPIPLSDLRYLIIPHFDGHGSVRLGEMVCHRSVARQLLDIFRELFAARYPIERMVLIDDYDADDERSMSANNTTCFCYRTVAGSRKLSRHSLGKAVDINPLYNPMVNRKSGTVVPGAAREWADRTIADNPYVVRRGDAAWRAFTRRGWRWGGSWRTRPDYQHFQL
ncbi:MAG: M15 family metallopeptidase [Paramuribaculum sp.]|nr:M15 family metallopeptidase [Paramuribaculum sp.]